MKVIKEGKVQTFQIYCQDCGSKLEYIKKDVYTMETLDHIIDYIICPVCGEKITIGLNKKNIKSNTIYTYVY